MYGGTVMPEFKLTKEYGSQNFEILMAIDYDYDGEIENMEFWTGSDWSENPAEMREINLVCDEEEQAEWNNFFNDFMHLLESDELIEKLVTLKNESDSCFFDEEDIKAVLTEED